MQSRAIETQRVWLKVSDCRLNASERLKVRFFERDGAGCTRITLRVCALKNLRSHWVFRVQQSDLPIAGLYAKTV
jgi:hypothetical protein